MYPVGGRLPHEGRDQDATKISNYSLEFWYWFRCHHLNRCRKFGRNFESVSEIGFYHTPPCGKFESPKPDPNSYLLAPRNVTIGQTRVLKGAALPPFKVARSRPLLKVVETLLTEMWRRFPSGENRRCSAPKHHQQNVQKCQPFDATVGLQPTWLLVCMRARESFV